MNVTSKIMKTLLVSLLCFLGMLIMLDAQQFDAPFYEFQTKNQKKWQAEDEEI